MTRESDEMIADLKERAPRLEMNIRRTTDLVVAEYYHKRLGQLANEALKRVLLLKDGGREFVGFLSDDEYAKKEAEIVKQQVEQQKKIVKILEQV